MRIITTTLAIILMITSAAISAKKYACEYIIIKTKKANPDVNFHNIGGGAFIYNLAIPSIGNTLYALTTNPSTCTSGYRINIQIPETLKSDWCYISAPINAKKPINGKYIIIKSFPRDFTYTKCAVK